MSVCITVPKTLKWTGIRENELEAAKYVIPALRLTLPFLWMPGTGFTALVPFQRLSPDDKPCFNSIPANPRTEYSRRYLRACKTHVISRIFVFMNYLCRHDDKGNCI
jgi:hypothetical protein